MPNKDWTWPRGLWNWTGRWMWTCIKTENKTTDNTDNTKFWQWQRWWWKCCAWRGRWQWQGRRQNQQ